MKWVSFFMMLYLLSSCSVRQKYTAYLSTGIENIKLFPANKIDSAKINIINITAKKSLEKCEKQKNVVCIDDLGTMILNAEFPKGISHFRNVLFEKFKLPKNVREGENRIRIILGINDNVEKIEILKYTDKNTKKAIEEVFKVKELNTWKSAKMYGIPVKEQFEISIFIENK
ncbi:hypothetical protein [Chryseobacterium sp.]|jgi:hypothetical protein|uniref:hypothetical protein n=1 Tax=Chryseobacterium sp. TaxID=1871047 RepID=UPI002849C926|nr:hypothetical protein [Chryseobacterium sp.]MDR3024523.1 hypothetical protein [Chryseobacterium sp.]